MNIKIGLTHTVRCVVDDTNTAQAVGSGDMPVFSTPSMIALMEEAALLLAIPYLLETQSTVGSSVQITHERATAMEQVVSATARLIEIDGRRLVYSVEASDSKGLIGRGRHERFIIDRERFLSKI